MERCRRSGWYRVVCCKVCYCTITCSTLYHTVGSGPAWRRRAGPVPTVQPYFVSPVSTVSYWLIRYLPCMIHPSCRLSGTEYIHTYTVTYALQNGRHDQSRVFFISRGLKFLTQLVMWSTPLFFLLAQVASQSSRSKFFLHPSPLPTRYRLWEFYRALFLFFALLARWSEPSRSFLSPTITLSLFHLRLFYWVHPPFHPITRQ